MSFTTTATLTIKNEDDFRRVLEFVKPDESDTEPQTDEEYQQVLNIYDSLLGPERCAWMTKHCTCLYVNFRAEPEIKELSWSGRNVQGGYACEIAELVLAQFPDIVFRISTGSDLDDLEFGISEQGKVRWLKLCDDVKEMFEWGIDVDPYVGPTPEQLESLRQHRRVRVQEMIDLGVHISPDTWPPSREQYDEEHRLRFSGSEVNEHRLGDIVENDDPDLPF